MMNVINKHDLLQISHAYIHTRIWSNEFYITMNLLHLAWCDTFANTLFMNDIVHKYKWHFANYYAHSKTNIAIARKLSLYIILYHTIRI